MEINLLGCDFCDVKVPAHEVKFGKNGPDTEWTILRVPVLSKENLSAEPELHICPGHPGLTINSVKAKAMEVFR